MKKMFLFLTVVLLIFSFYGCSAESDAPVSSSLLLTGKVTYISVDRMTVVIGELNDSNEFVKGTKSISLDISNAQLCAETKGNDKATKIKPTDIKLNDIVRLEESVDNLVKTITVLDI